MRRLSFNTQSCRHAARAFLQPMVLAGASVGVMVSVVLSPVAVSQQSQPLRTPPTQREAELYAELERVVQSALVPRRGPLDDQLLLALRSLKDPQLKPLFSWLATQQSPALQRHGILAVAELSHSGKLETVLVAGVNVPSVQASILGEALDLELIEPSQFEVVLRWPGLDPQLEVGIIARQIAAGLDADTHRLERLARMEEPGVSMYAALLQLHLGELEGGAGAMWQLVQDQPEADQRNDTGVLLSLAVHSTLTGTAGFARIAADNSGDVPQLVADAVHVMLQLGAPDASAYWSRAYADAGSLGQKLRLAIVALRNAKTLDDSALARLVNEEDPLLRKMGAAARAYRLGSGGGLGEALEELLQERYQFATEWVLQESDEMPPPDAIRALTWLVREAARRPSVSSRISPFEAQAARQLAKLDPFSLADPLLGACGRRDEVIAETVLMALIDRGAAPVWAIDAPPKWPTPRAEALAVLCLARSGAELTDEQVEKLASIGSGWGSLPRPYRVQAAWMALAQTGRSDRFISKVLAGS